MTWEGEFNTGAASGEIIMDVPNKIKLIGFYNNNCFSGTVHKFVFNG